MGAGGGEAGEAGPRGPWESLVASLLPSTHIQCRDRRAGNSSCYCSLLSGMPAQLFFLLMEGAGQGRREHVALLHRFPQNPYEQPDVRTLIVSLHYTYEPTLVVHILLPWRLCVPVFSTILGASQEPTTIASLQETQEASPLKMGRNVRHQLWFFITQSGDCLPCSPNSVPDHSLESA